MAKITFYPLGNADCCLIDFDNKRKMLVDYAHCRAGEDEEDLRIDLFNALHDDLEEDDREEWLNNEGLALEDREHLITDAGNLAPDFTKISDSTEVFIHSPFAFRDGDQLQDRNEGSLVFQVTFFLDNQETKFMLGADTTYDAWTDIVNITRNHDRDHRLVWDIFKLPHHCSYTALSNEKGEEKTEPVKEVKWLFEQGENGGIIISTSKPIREDDEDDQPPHRQAANYYKGRVAEIGGEFKVTMEHPKESKPEPLVIIIDGGGAAIKKTITGAAAVVTGRRAPRAGRRYEK